MRQQFVLERAFRAKSLLRQKPLYQTTFKVKAISVFTEKETICTKHILHQKTFTPEAFYTRLLYIKQGLHQAYFTLRKFCPKQVLYYQTVFYSSNLLRQKIFYAKHLYTKQLLHKKPLAPNKFYTKQFLHQKPFTPIDVVSTDCMMPAVNSHAVWGQRKLTDE